MKSLLLSSLAVFAATVVAQSSNPALIPDCAKECLGSINSLGAEIGCGQFDYKCICSNPTFISSISCCVSKRCDAADQKATLSFANTVCQVADVTLPSSASCAPGEQPTGINGAAGSASASSGSGSTTTTGSATGSGSSATTGTVSTTPSTNSGSATAASGSPTTSSATTSSSSGAAAQFLAQGAGAAGGLVAALAALL